MNQNCSILIVEDDANDVFFLSEAIRRSEVNIPFDVVNDGQSAIEFLSKAHERMQTAAGPVPCIVLLDLNLPRRSGMEVLRWIRQESPCKMIVVVILTASNSEADMRQAYQHGANSYVVKPTDVTRLRELSIFLKGYWLGWNQVPALFNGNGAN